MGEMSVMSVMKSIVPITRFNKGEANRIFEEVESGGPKIVMKNNTPACILISPDQYEVLMEMLADYSAWEEAEERMKHYDPQESMSQEEVTDFFGITQDDLADVDVEIE